MAFGTVLESGTGIVHMRLGYSGLEHADGGTHVVTI